MVFALCWFVFAVGLMAFGRLNGSDNITMAGAVMMVATCAFAG